VVNIEDVDGADLIVNHVADAVLAAASPPLLDSAGE
jgi:hypothetical protein